MNISRYDSEEEDDSNDEGIRWINLIFLPFNPLFEKLVIAVVIVKTILGPLQCVYPIVFCWETMELHVFTMIIKKFYAYFCDPIYGVDTFLHILHRQVTDQARRRQYLPKSIFLLLIDIISLIPFFHLLVDDICPPVQLWPNIVAISEFVIIYRIANYFSLLTSHSYMNIIFGYTLLLIIVVNCLTSVTILLTYHGLCERCTGDIFYDWRQSVQYKLNDTDISYNTYFYAATAILSYICNKLFDLIRPYTITEHILFNVLEFMGYLVFIFVLIAKMFTETLYRERNRWLFYIKVSRIIKETRRRNPSSDAYIDVQKFYTLMWKRRSGITSVPDVITQLPRYLRINIKEDLVWQLFFHSPMLRHTSESFKRLLCESIHIDYKLPGEKFYSGPLCHTYLYFLKSGVAQIISSEDGTTPLISVTSGTIFGDISFIFPNDKSNINVRCLTYCEVLYLTRADLSNSIRKYPDDRLMIMEHVKERIRHARTLYICKQHAKNSDRSEDEGIAWLKRRWWEISDTLDKWKASGNERNENKFEVPPEESLYHCAKYIGQLVLSNDAQLHTKSIFANFKFPWMFVSESIFHDIWKYIVYSTVFLVLIIYPPTISHLHIPKWFSVVEFWTDLIYIADMCISLLTYTLRHEDVSRDFAAIVFGRCKTLKFALDLSSTIWIEEILYMCGLKKHYYFYKYNRLIKIYILFRYSNIEHHPLNDTIYKVILTITSFFYVAIFFIYYIIIRNSALEMQYFFGNRFCAKFEQLSLPCDPESLGPAQLLFLYLTEFFFEIILPKTRQDIVVSICFYFFLFLISFHCKMKMLASMYFNCKEIVNYQNFVTNVCKLFKQHNIHPDLLKRLNRYLICHWKKNKGMDDMYPNLLKKEPYDIYLKVQGEVAEKVIKQSRMFNSADHALIKELAYKAKFLVLPRNATIILFGLPFKAVTWLLHGYVSCEYPDQNGEPMNRMFGPGDMLTCLSVFFGSVAIRSQATITECEIVYIDTKDFFETLKRYPNEWQCIRSCIEEFGDRIKTTVQQKKEDYDKYQKKLRLRVFHGNRVIKNTDSVKSLSKYCIDPESSFMKYWMLFRAVVVAISIFSASAQGQGYGAMYRRHCKIIGYICDSIGVISILLKFYLGYYDKNGILITSAYMRLKHYLRRGFICDIIGCLPCHILVNLLLSKPLTESQNLNINALSKYAHLYLLTGYINFRANMSTANYAVSMIAKWHVLILFYIITASQCYVGLYVDISWDSYDRIVNVTTRRACWMLDTRVINQELTLEDFQMVSITSLFVAQGSLMSYIAGSTDIDHEHSGIETVMSILPFLFWFLFCYLVTLLVLNFYRENTLFQHGVTQLEKFLTAERVDRNLITKTTAHFRYCWLRTKGINITLLYETIGNVFQQDLCNYFCKKSVEPFSDLVNGGEALQRELASTATLNYFLPGDLIVREMGLNPFVYIVHRGKILIKREDKELAILPKGSVFGQLEGAVPRPIRVTAVANEHSDVLQISIQDLQDNIDDEARKIIKNYTRHGNDYIKFKNIVIENPYNTIEYIIRGKKSIKLPWMLAPASAESRTWYKLWLYLTWVVVPLLSFTIALLACSFPLHVLSYLMWVLWTMDVLYIAHIITDFFMTELVVLNGKCVNRVLHWRIIKKWCFYVDVATIVLPMLPIGYWKYFCRTLRLRLLYDFHVSFCKGFRSQMAPVILKYIIVFSILHGIACAFILIVCRDEKLHTNILPPHENVSIDFDEWIYPGTRLGCVRYIDVLYQPGTGGCVVPRNWSGDYILAMTYVINVLTKSAISNELPSTYGVVMFTIVACFILYVLHLWLLSIAVSVIYTRLRELYVYDYSVTNVIKYLDMSGLCPVLLKSIKDYTQQLWKRQRGNWLPELVQQAPLCLREDMFESLYIHHFKLHPLFKNLPLYFTRQMVARVHRVVIFPEKFIVQEGDIFPCIYFIHEGEVEKWHTTNGGKSKMISILTTNGYFGLMPGLFPNKPFQFSYFSRTVVDLVFLRYRDWQDLLRSYPDIKEMLYKEVEQFKKEI